MSLKMDHSTMSLGRQSYITDRSYRGDSSKCAPVGVNTGMPSKFITNKYRLLLYKNGSKPEAQK